MNKLHNLNMKSEILKDATFLDKLSLHDKGINFDKDKLKEIYTKIVTNVFDPKRSPQTQTKIFFKDNNGISLSGITQFDLTKFARTNIDQFIEVLILLNKRIIKHKNEGKIVAKIKLITTYNDGGNTISDEININNNNTSFGKYRKNKCLNNCIKYLRSL